MSPRPAVLTGGCQCGAVRYALYELPTACYVCHCRMYQKAVGGPFLVVAPVAAADFAWTRGEPACFASSSIARRDFCAACGTPLTYRGDNSGRISVTVGTLDEPTRLTPTLQYDAGVRWPWLDRLAAVPAREDAGLAPEIAARLVCYQHPDHETPEGWSPPGS